MVASEAVSACLFFRCVSLFFVFFRHLPFFAFLFVYFSRSGRHGHAVEDQPGEPDADHGADEEGHEVSA